MTFAVKSRDLRHCGRFHASHLLPHQPSRARRVLEESFLSLGPHEWPWRAEAETELVWGIFAVET